MEANLIQYRLIARYAERHGLPLEMAARAWISRHAKAFRLWYGRHLAMPAA